MCHAKRRRVLRPSLRSQVRILHGGRDLLRQQVLLGRIRLLGRRLCWCCRAATERLQRVQFPSDELVLRPLRQQLLHPLQQRRYVLRLGLLPSRLCLHKRDLFCDYGERAAHCELGLARRLGRSWHRQRASSCCPFFDFNVICCHGRTDVQRVQ